MSPRDGSDCVFEGTLNSSDAGSQAIPDRLDKIEPELMELVMQLVAINTDSEKAEIMKDYEAKRACQVKDFEEATKSLATSNSLLPAIGRINSKSLALLKEKLDRSLAFLPVHIMQMKKRLIRSIEGLFIGRDTESGATETADLARNYRQLQNDLSCLNKKYESLVQHNNENIRDLQKEKRNHEETLQSRNALKAKLIEIKACYDVGVHIRKGALEQFHRNKPRSSQYYCEEQDNLRARRNHAAHRDNFRADAHCLKLEYPLLACDVKIHVEIYGIDYKQEVFGQVLLEIVNLRGTMALCRFFQHGSERQQTQVNKIYNRAWSKAKDTIARYPNNRQQAIEIINAELQGEHDKLYPIMERAEKEHIAYIHERYR